MLIYSCCGDPADGSSGTGCDHTDGDVVMACHCTECSSTCDISDDRPDDNEWRTSDDGEWYCSDCVDYTLDDGGQPVCPTHGANA